MNIQKRKIGIVGAGHVGSHAAYALASQSVCEEIVLIDVDKKKAEAQALDVFDSTVYLPRRTLVKAGSYSDIADAQVLIVAAAPLPDMSKGQTRMDTLAQTVAIIKDVVANIAQSGFSGIIVNISNPADVVTHYIQKKLNWQPSRIFSTSTTLDSARLRRAISVATGFDQKSIYAYALGEHGESQMVAWSCVTVAGKPILQLMKEQPEKYGALDLAELARHGKAGGWTILGGKGSTEFGIGATIAEVCRAVFADENRVLPVSVLLEGQYGQRDVYASVPAKVCANGIAEIIELKMTDEEQKLFAASCQTMRENYELALRM